MSQTTGKATQKAKPKKTKTFSKIDQFEKSKPLQLELFELANPSERHYSNTIELYDFIPKYVWGKVKRIQEKFLEPIEREFVCRGKGYQVRIAPARIKDSDGTSRDYFPGKREELVEDALRKIATGGQGVFLDDEAGVTSTLYQLQQELKRTGHSYSITQLKEALMVSSRNKSAINRHDRTGHPCLKYLRYDRTSNQRGLGRTGRCITLM